MGRGGAFGAAAPLKRQKNALLWYNRKANGGFGVSMLLCLLNLPSDGGHIASEAPIPLMLLKKLLHSLPEAFFYFLISGLKCFMPTHLF